MFGKFALSFIILFFSSLVRAAQTGVIIADEAYIYVAADFDAKIISTVKRGETFEISDKTQGPFYRIRLKNKQLGWISSVDIKPANTAKARQEIQRDLDKKQKESAKPLKDFTEEKKFVEAFERARFMGPRLEQLRWREKTLGSTHAEDLTFVGFGWTGMSAVTEAPLYVDASLMLSTALPKYYKKITGVEAKGWILKGQISALNARPLTEKTLYQYGLGLVTTFASLQPGLQNGSEVDRYNADEITVGVVLPFGLSYRVGPVALQAFYRFYFEKHTTTGISLGASWFY